MTSNGARADWRIFPTREALAGALAFHVADSLRRAVRNRGRAVLAVSGGTTPAKLFEALSRERLDWTKVAVTLVDERFVPPSSERSNERLVREKLLRNEAQLARFVALYSAADSAAEAAQRAEPGVALLGPRLDAAILGMGSDGHTASFFPDAPNLDALTDSAQPRRVMPVEAPSAGEPRITLTMPLLAGAGYLALHIEGEGKKQLLEKALAQTAPRLPIARVFDAASKPIDTYWAP